MKLKYIDLHEERKFIQWCINKYRKSGLPYDDLYQETIVAILEAEKKYRPDSKMKFTTYAFWKISNHLKKFCKQEYKERHDSLDYITKDYKLFHEVVPDQKTKDSEDILLDDERFDAILDVVSSLQDQEQNIATQYFILGIARDDLIVDDLTKRQTQNLFKKVLNKIVEEVN